jgi:mRNA interferase HigB
LHSAARSFTLFPLWEQMIIANRSALLEGWEKHADAKGALVAWFTEAEKAQWRSPSDIKVRYASASIWPGNVVVFNVRGNRYRLAVKVNYAAGIVMVQWFGTHAE